nr:MAG TPA: hypothetical protein [Caudoviricetes sp.]
MSIITYLARHARAFFLPICERTLKYLHINTHLNLTINRIVCIITHMADVPCFE